MKRFIAVALIAAALPAFATDVGVSISVGEPGFYGRIDIGNFPPPEFIYPKPIVIYPPAVGVVVHPVYLHVPPGHAKNWKQYCHQYAACNVPVYFVQERWYNDVYVPTYRKRHPDKGYDKDGHPGKGRGKGYDKD
jgi:hypothetical protein